MTAHVLDVARLCRLVLDRQKTGSRYHAVAEEGASTRQVAEVVGRSLHVPVVFLMPEQAAERLGWMAGLLAMDIPTSSVQTREQLEWTPNGPWTPRRHGADVPELADRMAPAGSPAKGPWS